MGGNNAMLKNVSLNALKMRENPCQLRTRGALSRQEFYASKTLSGSFSLLSVTPPISTASTPPETESHPQPGCFFLDSPEELRISSRLKDAACPYSNH